MRSKRGGSCLFESYSRRGSYIFSKFFLWGVLWWCFPFYRLRFLLTYFDLIWCFIVGSRLHFYMYIMPWHKVFTEDSCLFPSVSRLTRLRYRFFRFLLLLPLCFLISWVIQFWRVTTRSNNALYSVTVRLWIRVRGWLNVVLTVLHNRRENANMCLH